MAIRIASAIAWAQESRDPRADGQTLASCGADAGTKLWDLQTGDCLRTFEGHHSWVWDCAGDCLKTFEGHTSAISSLTFLPSMPMDNAAAPCLVSGSHDETIRLWNLTSGDCLQVLRSPRLYEGMTLAQVQGLSGAAIASLQELGAQP